MPSEWYSTSPPARNAATSGHCAVRPRRCCFHCKQAAGQASVVCRFAATAHSPLTPAGQCADRGAGRAGCWAAAAYLVDVRIIIQAHVPADRRHVWVLGLHRLAGFGVGALRLAHTFRGPADRVLRPRRRRESLKVIEGRRYNVSSGRTCRPGLSTNRAVQRTHQMRK